MHDHLGALGFEALRPLLGRLQGQGSLWCAPAGISVDDAIAAVIVIPGVADALSADIGRRPGDCLEEVEGQEVAPGKAFIGFDSDQRQAAADVLTEFGFTFDHDFNIITSEVWVFVPLEYSVVEAITIALQVAGVLRASPVPVLHGDSLHGDVTDDGIINILDMIAIRNHLNDPAASWPSFDVNADGFINVLDMIYIRNRLGNSLLTDCTEWRN